MPRLSIVASYSRLKLYVDSSSHERLMGCITIIHCVFLGMQFSAQTADHSDGL